MGSKRRRGGVAQARGRGETEPPSTPNSRNRLDAWIAFAPLSFETIERVVDKFVAEVRAQLVEKNVELVLTERARRWLAEHGYDKQRGAPPRAPPIQDRKKAPLPGATRLGTLKGGAR